MKAVTYMRNFIQLNIYCDSLKVDYVFMIWANFPHCFSLIHQGRDLLALIEPASWISTVPARLRFSCILVGYDSSCFYSNFPSVVNIINIQEKFCEINAILFLVYFSIVLNFLHFILTPRCHYETILGEQFHIAHDLISVSFQLLHQNKPCVAQPNLANSSWLLISHEYSFGFGTPQQNTQNHLLQQLGLVESQKEILEVWKDT